MKKKIDILNEMGMGEFIAINDTNDTIYKSESADAMVLTAKEFANIIKERLKEAIPYTNNEILKVHLPAKFHLNIVLEELKELSKYDHTILSNSIIDEDLFFYDMMELEENKYLPDLVLGESLLFLRDGYRILISETETAD